MKRTCFFIGALVCAMLLQAQTLPQPPFPATPPDSVTREMDFAQMLHQMGIVLPTLPTMADDPNRPPYLVPVPNRPGHWRKPDGDERRRSFWGLWTNYDERACGFFPGPDSVRLGQYAPIDLLMSPSGKRISTAKEWYAVQRPAIARAVQNERFGFMPPKSEWPAVAFSADTSTGEAGGYRYRQQEIVGSISCDRYPQVRNKPQIIATLRTPVNAKGPVPVMIIFGGWGDMRDFYWKLCAPQGWGVCVLDPNKLQPDNGQFLTSYFIGLLNKGAWRKPTDIGSIGAWTWGVGRLIDYFETQPAVNARAVGLMGHSRYGKTTLYAMAFEPRLAIAFVSDAGSLGSSMTRRHFGQDLETSALPSEYHWLAGAFMRFAGPLHEGQYLPRKVANMTTDAHSIIALCAPRPVFVNGGSESLWADPFGMYLGCAAATPVYELLGVKGLVMPDAKPALDKAYVDGTIGFRYHKGGHIDLPDWPAFFELAKREVNLNSKK